MDGPMFKGLRIKEEEGKGNLSIWKSIYIKLGDLEMLKPVSIPHLLAFF